MAEIVPLVQPTTAAARAQQWIVRIDRAPLTTDERAALHAWLAQDPQHGALLDQHAMLWHAAGKVRARAAAQAANTAARRQPGRTGIGIGMALAAGMAALLLWPGSLMQPGTPATPETPAIASLLQAATGQQQRFALSDGSRIALNTNSMAQSRYSATQRQIVLQQGEGWFEVAKDRKRPFTVAAGATTVRAVGTRFAVYRHADQRVEVTVEEGVVDVSVAGSPTRLVAGQMLMTGPAGFERRQMDAGQMAQRLAWRQGRVVFNATPLTMVLQALNRYSTLPIRIGDPRLATVKVSGAFSTANIEALLSTLEQGFAVRVTKDRDGYLVLPAAAGRWQGTQG